MLIEKIAQCHHIKDLYAILSDLQLVGNLDGREIRVMSADASDTIPISLISNKFLELTSSPPTPEEQADHQKILDKLKILDQGTFTELQHTYNSIRLDQQLQAYLADPTAIGGKRIVIDRIRKTFDEQSVILDLSDLYINKLPSCLNLLPQLQYLYLSRNKLTMLPPEIWQLSQLQTLELAGNQLTALPHEIGQLSKLEFFNLAGNQLSTLPSEAKNLHLLRKITLTNNKLSALPPWIGQLSHLRECYLSHNELTALPSEMGQCSQMQYIDLNDNRFTVFPVELLQFSQLHSLCLANNRLTALPPRISQFTQLQHLFLSNNALTTLPAEIGLLTQLKYLFLNNINLTTLPPEIGQLHSLTALILSNNQLTVLPLEIGQLHSLTTLDLSNNQLIELPPAIGQLMQLQLLGLPHNRLVALPSTLGNLTQLGRLIIHHNSDLRELPLTLGSLAELSYIDIEGTALTPELRDAILSQFAAVRRAQAHFVLPHRLQKWLAAGRVQIDLSEIEQFPEDAKGTLNEWLMRLEKTNDFRGNQQSLAQTVCEMLHDMAQNAELKALFLAQMSANNENCQDRAAQAFNELYTAWKVQQLPENVPLQEKLDIMIRGAKTLALRAAIAECIKKQEQEIGWEYDESVESYLFYELALKERLNLLSVIQNMGYARIGKRDWIDEDHLIAVVQKTYIDHLIALPVFTKLLKDNQAFKEMWDPQEHLFTERIASLDESPQATSPELSEEYFQYTHEMNAVGQERKQRYQETVTKWLVTERILL